LTVGPLEFALGIKFVEGGPSWEVDRNPPGRNVKGWSAGLHDARKSSEVELR
jgi:hypothetical protein